MNIFLSPFAPENVVSRGGFDRPVPRQPSDFLYSVQYFGEIKNTLFFKEQTFFLKSQKTLFHVAHVLPRVIPIG